RITVLYGSEKDSYRRIAGIHYMKVSVGAIPSRSLRKIYFSLRVRKILQDPEFANQISLSLGRTGLADIVIAAGNYPGTKREDIVNSSWFKNPMYYLDKISFKECKHIFAASELVKNELEELFNISEKRITVLYPPIKIEDYSKVASDRKQELYKRFGMDPNRKNFLFVSTGHKRKGLPFLLDIFASLNPDKYVLYVAGNRFESTLPNVKYLGYVEKTADLYNISDCLLHPASYEAFGQVITESLICGLPVLVSDRVGAREIVNEDNGKILPYNDKDAWKDAIINFGEKRSFDANWLVKDLSIEAHVDKMLSEWTGYEN
ncbi:MAG: glycosyltransferase family 4 protein, partial [Cyclobacteriaceae bacterium]